MSDRTLEQEFEHFRAHGEPAALGRVFDALAPELSRIACHLSFDRAEAEDLVQAAFLTAIEKRDTFDATRPLAPWLTGILLRHAASARRERRRVLVPDRLTAREVEDPAETVSARELSEALTAALSRLSTADREVLVPLLLNGRRAVEIARELGRRPDTIHMRIHRGMARLRRLLPAGAGLGATGFLTGTRSLAAVRERVLDAAHLQLGTSASAGGSLVVFTGVAWTMKKLAVLAAAVVLGLVIWNGYSAMHTEASVSSRSRDETLVASTPHPSRQPALALMADPESSPSQRTGMPSAQVGAAEHQVEFHVVHADRTPAAEALVVIVDSSERMSTARTDERGACTFTLGKGQADMFVRDTARLPVHVVMSIEDASRHTIEIPSGSTLSGRLRTARGELLPAIDLTLTANSAPEAFARASLDVFRALDLVDYESKSYTARTRCAADGGFRFADLPASWSGTLSLPREFVFVDADGTTTSSERVVERPADGLDLVIDRRPRIIGRLVDAASRAPLAHAQFDCSLEWSDGNAMGMGGPRTDADGRFSIPLDVRVDAVGLRIARVRDESGAVAHAEGIPKWNPPSDPHDVGDVACVFPRSRAVVLRVVDTEGRPVAGARARVGDQAIVTSGSDGLARLPAVPFDAREVCVVAAGRARRELDLDADSPAEITVTLPRTNRLTIRLPEGAHDRDVRVELVSSGLLFGGRTRMYDSELRGGMVGRCVTADGDAGTREGMVRFRFDADGRLELEDIATDVPFRIHVRDTDSAWKSPRLPALYELAIASLGAEEQREVEIPLSALRGSLQHAVRGRVVDESGQPVMDASVARCFGCGLTYASSALDGSFLLHATGEEVVDVEIAKRGYVPFRVRGWDVRSSASIEARLVRAEDLRVDLVDPRGRPLVGGELTAEIDGFGPPWRVEKASDSAFALCDLPTGEVRIQVVLAGRTYSRSCDARAGTFRFELPEHGRVTVTWPSRGSAGGTDEHWIVLRPRGSDGAELATVVYEYAASREQVFPCVLPGDYAVSFERHDWDATREVTVIAPYHDPVSLTVVGGRSHELTLRR